MSEFAGKVSEADAAFVAPNTGDSVVVVEAADVLQGELPTTTDTLATSKARIQVATRPPGFVFDAMLGEVPATTAYGVDALPPMGQRSTAEGLDSR